MTITLLDPNKYEFRVFSAIRNRTAERMLNHYSKFGWKIYVRDYTAFGVRYTMVRPIKEVPFGDEFFFSSEDR